MMNKHDKIQHAKHNMADLLDIPHNVFDLPDNFFAAHSRMTFWMTTFGGNAVVMGRDDIIDWAREKFADTAAEDMLDADNIRLIDGFLGKFGYKLSSVDIRYLHLFPDVEVNQPKGFAFKFFDGDKAVDFITNLPDYPSDLPADSIFRTKAQDVDGSTMLCAAFDGDAAVSIATAYSDRGMWAFGRVDTLPSHGGLGLGRYMTKELTKKLEESGEVVYYTTWAGNLRSTRLALGAGFSPVWVGVYAVRL